MDTLGICTTTDSVPALVTTTAAIAHAGGCAPKAASARKHEAADRAPRVLVLRAGVLGGRVRRRRSVPALRVVARRLEVRSEAEVETLKPHIRHIHNHFWIDSFRWRVDYGFFSAHFVEWRDALEFALKLRYRRVPSEA